MNAPAAEIEFFVAGEQGRYAPTKPWIQNLTFIPICTYRWP